MPPKSPKLGGLFSKTGIFISRNRLSIKGIHIIVHNSFPDKSQFSLLLHQSLEEDEGKPYITLKVAKVWRKSTNEEYDEIGAKIIAVDLEAELQKLIKYCDNKLLKKYRI